ncbi:MAG: hypothetical protein HC923_08110 [Myxococcales bacterium]|nr:hypothetical protein [Myxococcales bacterium]
MSTESPFAPSLEAERMIEAALRKLDGGSLRAAIIGAGRSGRAAEELLRGRGPRRPLR